MIGVDLAPGNGFSRRSTRQTSGIGSRVGGLEKIVVSTLLDLQDLANLRFRLQQKILRAAAAENPDGRLSAASFCIENNGGGLIHVGADVEHQPVSLERPGGDVHPDRGIAGSR